MNYVMKGVALMKTVIGIDVGGSTTKIVGFDPSGELITPMFVRAHDQITSIYGALGRFTCENSIELSDIAKIMVTGVGSTYIANDIYNIPCEHLSEFPCVGRGGLYLTGLEDAVVISMGTGTAIVHATKDESVYLGGTGVGGGTLVGLSKLLTGLSRIPNIVEAAAGGDLSKIDLRVSDISKTKIHPGLSPDLTAANFGRVSELATKEDIELGLINMVLETIAMQAVFAARSCGVKDIVLTGNLSTIPQAKATFLPLSDQFDVNFIIPDNSQFATVIGAALDGKKIIKKRK